MADTLAWTPVVFLCFAGRAGGGFLQSLLDGHEQILMIPTELQFHQTWERLRCGPDMSPAQLADLWCMQTKLTRLRTGIHYGLEEGTNMFTPCDPDDYRRRLEAQLARYGTSRRATFLAVHHAYAEATHQDLSRIRCIVEMPAYPQRLPDALQDFPDASVLQIVRDHRANYASYLSQRRPIAVLSELRDGLLVLNRTRASLAPRRFHVVRLEDLHLAHEQTVDTLARWLGVDVHPSLRASTLGGIPWLGNSSTGQAVRGVSPSVTTRWRSQLGGRDIRVVEAVVGDDLQRHGYDVSGPRGSLPRRIMMAVLPLRGELLWGVPPGAPAHPALRRMWRIHPGLVAALRALRVLPRFAADRVRLIRMMTRVDDFALSRPA